MREGESAVRIPPVRSGGLTCSVSGTNGGGPERNDRRGRRMIREGGPDAAASGLRCARPPGDGAPGKAVPALRLPQGLTTDGLSEASERYLRRLLLRMCGVWWNAPHGVWGLQWRRVLPEPGGEGFLGFFAEGEAKHGKIFFFAGRGDFEAVAREKSAVNDVSGALVAVEEGVVLRDAERVGCGKGAEIGRRFAAAPKMERPRKGVFKQNLLAGSGFAAVLGELPLVKGERGRPFSNPRRR